MAVYNSSASLNQEDTDITIINHSFLYNHNDEPISACIPVLRRSQQANRAKPVNDQINSDTKKDFIIIDQDSVETANQIERILSYYRQELKQESTTQLNCNQQLITRLIDFIRPAYSSHKQKMNDLDTLFADISTLHDEKCLDQKEKTEQLYSEIAYLKKLIITAANEDDTGRNTMTKIYRIDSMVNYEQWMEMEEETKKLHNLVEIQRDQIDKLIGLLSETDIINNEKFQTPVRTTANKPTKTCTLCNYQFPPTFNEAQIIAHMEKCSSTIGIDNLNISLDSTQWECPYCNQKLLNDDGMTYMEHLSQCYNRVTGNI